jgi:hypothetical protein
MFSAFFALAVQSPSRQLSFRKAVVVHVVILAAASLALIKTTNHPGEGSALFGTIALIVGIVEGATLLGWRLTQLPKSQALEFLLVSPLRPRRLFVAEALVGMSRLALVTLCGLPILVWLISRGFLDPLDMAPLLIMPLTWGAITGLGLSVWAYEPVGVRRWGERFMIALVVLYLAIGVLAGENLKAWLAWLPDEGQLLVMNAFLAIHRYNPFQLIAYWMQNDIKLSIEPVCWLQAAAMVVLLVLLTRCACRLQGHFRELHYQPHLDPTSLRRPPMTDRPLSWWSTRRVMRYSGRINFWLIGGFSILYSLYSIAGAHWPAWLGKAVFLICDNLGGLGGLATALVLLAAVPAAFQYGLWDSNAQDRCRRLELLLLAPLRPHDYWDAASAAAWKRGRGYFGVACLLWSAAWLSDQADSMQIIAALASGVLLWGLYFALGFRAFSRGLQANGLGMSLTLGLPILAYGLFKVGWPTVAALIPPAGVQLAMRQPADWQWLLGPVLTGTVALIVSRYGLAHCDRELRLWYEAHHGSKVMT